MTPHTPSQEDMKKLMPELETLAETLQNASMSYGASIVTKAISIIRSLEDRNVDLSTNNKMLLTRQKALEKDHASMKEALEDLRLCYCDRNPWGNKPCKRCKALSSLLIK